MFFFILHLFPSFKVGYNYFFNMEKQEITGIFMEENTSPSKEDSVSKAAIQAIPSRLIEVLERRDEVMKQMLGDVKILLAQLDPVSTNTHQTEKCVKTNRANQETLYTNIENYAKQCLEGEQSLNFLREQLNKENAGLVLKESSAATIKNLQDKNRLLESSNQRLTHQLEQLKSLLRQHSSHMDTSRGIMKEDLSQKNNERLRVNLMAVQSQMSSTERKLEEAKVLADSLKSQVQNLQVEMNRKHKLRSEQEVEREAENKRLREELITKSQVLSEAIQAADVLIDDLIALKKLLKVAGTDVQINWTRLESRGNSLKDVMHVCRCCVNEVGQEVLKSQNMLKQAEQINVCLNEKTKELAQHVGILEEQTISLTRELQQAIKDRDEISQEKYNVIDQNIRLQDEKAVLVEQFKSSEIKQEILKAEKEILAKQQQMLQEDMQILLKEDVLLREQLASTLDHLNMSKQDSKQKMHEALSNLHFVQEMLVQTQDDNTRLKKLLDENNKIVNDHHRTLEEKEKLITYLQTCLCDLNEVGQQEVLTLNREKEQLECALELESSINTGELDTAQEENSRMKQILEMKERDLDSAAHNIKEQEKQLAQLRQERDNLISSYQENLKSKEDILMLREKLINHENIVLQRDQLAASQVELLEQINNYRNNLESLQQNNEQLINCHQQLSIKVNDLENELHKVSEALNKSKEVIDASYQENCYLIIELKSRNDQIEELEKTIDEMKHHERENLTKLENKMDSLIQENNYFHSKFKSLQQNMNDMSNKLKETEDKLLLKTNKVLKLDEKLVKVTDELNNSKESFLSKSNYAHLMLYKYEEANNRIEEFKRIEMDKNELASQLEQDIKNKFMENVKLKEQLKKTSEVKEQEQISLMDTLKNVEKKLLDERENCKSLKEKIKVLEKKREEAVTSVKDLKHNLQEATEKLLEQQNEHTQYKECVAKKDNEFRNFLLYYNDKMDHLQEIVVISEANKEQMFQEILALRYALYELEGHNKTLEEIVANHGGIITSQNSKNKNESQYNPTNNPEEFGSKECISMNKTLEETSRQPNDCQIDKMEKEQQINNLESVCATQKINLLSGTKLGATGCVCEEEKLSNDHRTVREYSQQEHEELIEKLVQGVHLIMDEKMKKKYFQEQNQELSKLVAQLEVEKELLNRTIIKLTDEVNRLQSDKSSVRRDNKVLQEKFESLEDEQDKLRQSMSNLKRKSRNIYKKYNASKDKHKREKIALEALNSFKDDEIQDKQAQIQSWEERWQRVSKELIEARETILKHTHTISAKDKDIVRLQAERRDLSLKLQEFNVMSQTREQVQQQTLNRLVDELTKLQGADSNNSLSTIMYLLDQLTLFTDSEGNQAEVEKLNKSHKV